MKSDLLQDAIGEVRDDYIQDADLAPVRKKSGWLKWGAMAACLCLVLAAAIFGPEDQTPADAPMPAETDSQGAAAQATEGLYIPAVELPENSAGVVYDVIGLVVYNGAIYTQAEDYFGDVAQRVDALVGDYLGYASGTIDEWSEQEQYAQNFASTVSGEVYAVNGYDTDFRICIRTEVEGENGEPVLWIQFLDRLNGITLTTGEDLFASRLHIRGNVERIQWQSHDDWNWDNGNLQDAALDPDLWDEFLRQMEAGTFLCTWDSGSQQTDPTSGEASIYATPHQAHLILTMKDNTSVRLRLIDGGYVGYDALGWYFVRIPGEVFDAVYDACGGT